MGEFKAAGCLVLNLKLIKQYLVLEDPKTGEKISVGNLYLKPEAGGVNAESAGLAVLKLFHKSLSDTYKAKEPETYLSVKEVSKLLQISPSSVRRLKSLTPIRTESGYRKYPASQVIPLVRR